MADKPIFQLKVTLLGIEPPIWRRLLVHRETTLHELHHILQDAMGWANGHLHAFRIGKESYSDYRDEFDGPAFRDETSVPLQRVTGLRKRFVYEYDFGDGWEHLIAVEKELPIEPGVDYPRCIDGARACPPEDCGGPPGYAEMLKVLGDPSDRDHADLMEWLGGDHDPEAFDVAATDARLREPGCGCDDHNHNHDKDDFDDSEDIDDVDDIVELTPEQLAGLTEEQLIDYLVDLADRVPRTVIDVCAARGAAMVQELATVCADDEFWEVEDDEDGWQWLRLHGPFILGLIGGEAAARLLISWLYRLDEVDDGDAQDSLAGYWPALLRDAPATALPHLLAAGRDTDLRWYARCQAVEAYLACRARSGAEALEHALDEVAAIAANEAENATDRVMIATILLSFPRERHRELLEQLAARNEPWTIEMQDVAEAFARNEDDPPWTAFANPWHCYEPDAIEQRRRRWAEEAAAKAAYDAPEYDDDGLDPSRDVDPDYDERTVVRATPKVGRNDPCPCGSGRKYKKCCMNAGGAAVH